MVGFINELRGEFGAFGFFEDYLKKL